MLDGATSRQGERNRGQESIDQRRAGWPAGEGSHRELGRLLRQGGAGDAAPRPVLRPLGRRWWSRDRGVANAPVVHFGRGGERVREQGHHGGHLGE